MTDEPSPDRAALSILSDRTRKLALQHIEADEAVFLCLGGVSGQCLVALADRVLIVKTGIMAGHTFGGQVIAFPYGEITGIEIKTHLTTAVLQIQTASFSGSRPGGYWSHEKGTDPFKLPNCLPAPKRVVAAWQDRLTTLRTAVANGGFGEPVLPAAESPSPSTATGLPEQMKQLAELHESGVLTDDEFAQAKAKLLS